MPESKKPLTYREAGVDIDAGDELVERIKPHVRKTFRPEVIGDLGGFGGLFAVPRGYQDPVLVSGTDGVGTKLKVAFATGRHDTIGIDLVAMCVNDVAVSGAEPLFFLDYFAAEAGDVRSVLLPYVIVLVSIGAVAQFISRGLIGVYVPPQMLLGMRYGGGFLRTPVPSLIASVVSIAIGCGAWWLFSFMLIKLAPTFGARSDGDAARKAAAYIATPIWLAGALALLQSIPYMGIVNLAGHVAALAYAVFIGMQALPVLLGTPESKAVNHTLAALAITVLAAVLATGILFFAVVRA